MSTICAPNGGTLSRMSINNYLGALRLSGDGVAISNLGPIVSIQAAENVIVQLQTAFDNTLHITPFGDKPGQLVITVLNGRVCNDGVFASDLTAYQYYRRHRYKDGGAPKRISVGPVPFSAILYGVSMSIDSKSLMPTVVLTFVAWEP